MLCLAHYKFDIWLFISIVSLDRRAQHSMAIHYIMWTVQCVHFTYISVGCCVYFPVCWKLCSQRGNREHANCCVTRGFGFITAKAFRQVWSIGFRASSCVGRSIGTVTGTECNDNPHTWPNAPIQHRSQGDPNQSTVILCSCTARALLSLSIIYYLEFVGRRNLSFQWIRKANPGVAHSRLHNSHTHTALSVACWCESKTRRDNSGRLVASCQPRNGAGCQNAADQMVDW